MGSVTLREYVLVFVFVCMCVCWHRSKFALMNSKTIRFLINFQLGTICILQSIETRSIQMDSSVEWWLWNLCANTHTIHPPPAKRIKNIGSGWGEFCEKGSSMGTTIRTNDLPTENTISFSCKTRFNKFRNVGHVVVSVESRISIASHPSTFKPRWSKNGMAQHRLNDDLRC